MANGYFPSETILANLEGQNLEGPGALTKSLLGNQVSVYQDGETPPSIYVLGNGQLLPGSKVTKADIQTCAGVVHIIDEVMLPDDPSAAVFPSSAPPLVETPASEAEGPITSQPRCKPGLNVTDTPSEAPGSSFVVDYDEDADAVPPAAGAGAPQIT